MNETAAKRYLLFDDGILALTEEKDVFLGRDSKSCDIFFFDERVSRKHARVFCRNGSYYIQDLDSINGVMVNDKRVHGAVELVEGDVIALRPHEIQFVGAETANLGIAAPASESQREDAMPVQIESDEAVAEVQETPAATIAVHRDRQRVIRVQPTVNPDQRRSVARAVKIIRKKR